ncbi:MAG: polysaccharide biosynthesis/export family protein [Bryobacteraceae bacterium]
MRVLIGVVMAAALAAQTRPVEVGGANLPAQKIGANDLIAVSVYDAPEFTRTVRVGADGQIRLPMLKQRLRAEGLLPGELEGAIAQALQAERILVDPVVTVTVVEYHSRPISVAGAVKNPVTFQAIGAVSLLEALTRAGGLSQEAGPEILVTRTQPGPDGAPVTLTRRIAVKALIDAADPEVNVKLYGGEEIRVPEAAKIFVVGNVKKPGAYPIGDTTETTVLRMLAVAEGLAPYAGKQAYIIRRDDRTGARHELPIELKKILERKAPDVPLVANDILYVPDNSGKRATVNVLDRIAGFGAATASGVLIWRR